ncbi:MAG: biotin--[acetyl-CoA-carboxylase] ligase [Verrucomicrobiota bacterium]
MSPDLIRAFADSLPPDLRLRCVSQTDSTNRQARAEWQGPPLALFADHQSAGRGRRGNRWFSPAGHSLLFSLALAPPTSAESWSLLTQAVGVAVAELLRQETRIQACLKWPNDVLVEDRKIAGILLESDLQSGLVVIGIGLNVLSQKEDFPEELRESATSVLREAPTLAQETHPREWLAGQLLHHLFQWLDRPAQTILATASAQSCLLDRLVELQTSSGPRRGLVRGLGPQGELLLEENGTLHPILQAHEVRPLPSTYF